jgi:hypothetical protein
MNNRLSSAPSAGSNPTSGRKIVPATDGNNAVMDVLTHSYAQYVLKWCWRTRNPWEELCRNY